MSFLRPGTRIADRYVIAERLGEGAMGVVYVARDEKLRRQVAIKTLSPKRMGNSDARSRLKREARAAAALDNPGIAQVFDTGETPDGGAFLVMELVRGKSVRELRASSLERAEALRIVREVARTLGAAHHAGLVHRDVKPDNMMVREDGRVVLLDFGIAKVMDQAEREVSDDPDSVVTAQGAILGTPPYIAPEQIRARNVGPASDQFSLAVVAYRLLTGKAPWEAPSDLGLLGQILTEPPRRASDAAPSLPEAADAVFVRAFAKDPAQRFPNVEAFADALEAAVTGKAPEAAAEAAPAPEKKPVELPPELLTGPPAPSPVRAPSLPELPMPDVKLLPPLPVAAPIEEPRRPTWMIAVVVLLVVAAAGVWLALR